MQYVSYVLREIAKTVIFTNLMNMTSLLCVRTAMIRKKVVIIADLKNPSSLPMGGYEEDIDDYFDDNSMGALNDCHVDEVSFYDN